MKEPKTDPAKKKPPWRQLLQTAPIKTDGVITGWKTLPNVYNASMILTHHPAWKGVIWYDQFADQISKARRPPMAKGLTACPSVVGGWTDADTNMARAWFLSVEKVDLSVTDLLAAISVAARQASRHPVRDYLKTLKWDGEERLETVLSDIFGAEDNEYTRGVGRLWFVSAIARVMQPGCQADYTLVLESPQGSGKNRSLRALVPERDWFSDTGITLGDKDSYQNLHGVWLYCLDEMAAVHGSEVAKVKNFLTGTVDRYRKSYGHFVETVPRQNIFVCTINPEAGGYFADRTGNRRFWPVEMKRPADATKLAKIRDQLWAEAKALYDKKVKWWPDEKLLRLCEEQQKQRVQIDPWVEEIQLWLEAGAPKRDDAGYMTHERLPVSRGVTTAEISWHVLHLPAGQKTRGTAMRIASALKEVGWDNSSRETHEGVRDRYYKLGSAKLRVVGQPINPNP